MVVSGKSWPVWRRSCWRRARVDSPACCRHCSNSVLKLSPAGRSGHRRLAGAVKGGRSRRPPAAWRRAASSARLARARTVAGERRRPATVVESPAGRPASVGRRRGPAPPPGPTKPAAADASVHGRRRWPSTAIARPAPGRPAARRVESADRAGRRRRWRPARRRSRPAGGKWPSRSSITPGTGRGAARLVEEVEDGGGHRVGVGVVVEPARPRCHRPRGRRPGGRGGAGRAWPPGRSRGCGRWRRGWPRRAGGGRRCARAAR